MFLEDSDKCEKSSTHPSAMISETATRVYRRLMNLQNLFDPSNNGTTTSNTKQTISKMTADSSGVSMLCKSLIYSGNRYI